MTRTSPMNVRSSHRPLEIGWSSMFSILSGSITTTIVAVPKEDLLAKAPTAENATAFENFSTNKTGLAIQPIEYCLAERSFLGTHTIYHESQATIRWFQIDADTDETLQEGLIADNELEFYYGSFAVNNFNNVVIGFSGSSKTQCLAIKILCWFSKADRPSHISAIN